MVTAQRSKGIRTNNAAIACTHIMFVVLLHGIPLVAFGVFVINGDKHRV